MLAQVLAMGPEGVWLHNPRWQSFSGEFKAIEFCIPWRFIVSMAADPTGDFALEGGAARLGDLN